MKRTFVIALGLVLVFVLSSCAPVPSAGQPQAAAPAAQPAATAQPAAAQPAAGAKKTVGLVQIDLSNPFHLGEVEGAKEAARRFGFELKVTSGEGDVNKQIQAVENLINQKVDALADQLHRHQGLRSDPAEGPGGRYPCRLPAQRWPRGARRCSASTSGTPAASTASTPSSF